MAAIAVASVVGATTPFIMKPDKPKAPKPIAIPKAPQPTEDVEKRPEGLTTRQREASRLGTSQLRIPLNRVNS